MNREEQPPKSVLPKQCVKEGPDEKANFPVSGLLKREHTKPKVLVKDPSREFLVAKKHIVQPKNQASISPRKELPTLADKPTAEVGMVSLMKKSPSKILTRVLQ